MPDLSLDGVHRFWRDYEDPMIYRVIMFMEGVEYWTLDGDPTLEQALTNLSEELNDIANVEIGNENEIIKICANIKMGRALRLLHCIDTVHPGAASKLLIHAEEVSQSQEDPAGIFLRRNIVFERLRLLARIFSPERLALILKSMEEDDHD